LPEARAAAYELRFDDSGSYTQTRVIGTRLPEADLR
jgi:hypothetical protein